MSRTNKTEIYCREFSSFRDPSGTVFEKEGIIYRQINGYYLNQYNHLIQSGLYDSLKRSGNLICHEEVSLSGISKDCIIVIRPERIPFISYPYEWTFGQLKDAALLTLRIHLKALEHGMILKDASSYNIQFKDGTPILIDSLSFDFYNEGMPWVAYGQFCRHFLAPLLLMRHVDIRLNRLLALYIDGVPLDLASSLLKGKGGFFTLQNIHWHSKSIAKHAGDGKNPRGIKSINLPKSRHVALIESLIRGVEKLALKNLQTEWGAYYGGTNYSDNSAEHKKELVSSFLQQIQPATVWDLGANDGTYSRLALEHNAHVTAFDIDPVAVERNYSFVKRERLNMLPLVLDLTNPSPAIGFGNREREIIEKRQKPDCVMALALIHHLAISNNLPLNNLASWLSKVCSHLIIEFVPKKDLQVQILLATREDIFSAYTQEAFEAAFNSHFIRRCSESIIGTCRTLYWYQSRNL
jgi:hypothetical protein